MTVRRVHFILFGVPLVLAAGVVALEVGVSRGWFRPLPSPGVTAEPPPYYAAVKNGELRFADIRDRRSADQEREKTDDEQLGELDQPERGTWKKWEKYEATFSLSWTFANPYDPDEIAVDAIVTTPSGRVESAPAFWFVPCDNQIVERTEPVIDPDEDTGAVEVIAQKDPGPGTWMLRYTPREDGAYSYRLVARTPAVAAWSAVESFTVAGSSGHGFARVSRRDPRYFEFDDGSFFFPVGQNVGWVNDLGSVDFARYMSTMKAYGANWARVWLTSYFEGQTVEWSRKNRYFHGLGFYSAEAAWKLDRMLQAAEHDGLLLMWCVHQHGQFSTRYNSCWDENPYNRACGGFLDEPEQFLTHPRARKLFQQRMRYYVARYAYSPNLFAWEFWNEVDLTDRFSGAAYTAWHKEMADYVKALDPTGRLLSTSYVYPYDRDAFALPANDFTQVHIYHSGPIEWMEWAVKSIDEEIRTVDNGRQPAKPVLIGEYGLSHSTDYFRVGPDSRWPVDPDGLHIHNGLWMGLFSGSAGTAMPWWWDRYIDRNNLYFHFTGISRYLAREDLRPWELARVKLFDDAYRTPGVLAYALVGPDRAYGWALETTYTMKNFAPGDTPRRDVRIRLEKMKDGPCWVECWDTYDGVVVAREKAEVDRGSLDFKLPPFRGDLAFKVVRDEPTHDVKTETPTHDRMVERLRELARRFKPRADGTPPPDWDNEPTTRPANEPTTRPAATD